jgi:hypothetical protein
MIRIVSPDPDVYDFFDPGLPARGIPSQAPANAGFGEKFGKADAITTDFSRISGKSLSFSGKFDLRIRDGLQQAYPEIVTPAVLDALNELASFDDDRKEIETVASRQSPAVTHDWRPATGD